MEDMKASVKYILFLLIPVIFAMPCLWHSRSVMNGYQDCRTTYNLLHTIPMPPAPPNCADAQRLMSYDISQNLGLALLFIPIGILIFWVLREYLSNQEGEKIKIVD
jgi:hypothetical protein